MAAAKATRPEPAGKEMPRGKRVCESPPVPTRSGNSIRFSHEWMIPSPGLSETPAEPDQGVSQTPAESDSVKCLRRPTRGVSQECIMDHPVSWSQ